MYRLKVFHHGKWFTISSNENLEEIRSELDAAKRRTPRSAFRITHEVVVYNEATEERQ